MHARWFAVIAAWIMTGSFLSFCAKAWGPEYIASVIGIAVFALIILALVSLLTLLAEADMGKKGQPTDRADTVHDCNAHE